MEYITPCGDTELDKPMYKSVFNNINFLNNFLKTIVSYLNNEKDRDIDKKMTLIYNELKKYNTRLMNYMEERQINYIMKNNDINGSPEYVYKLLEKEQIEAINVLLNLPSIDKDINTINEKLLKQQNKSKKEEPKNEIKTNQVFNDMAKNNIKFNEFEFIEKENYKEPKDLKEHSDNDTINSNNSEGESKPPKQDKTIITNTTIMSHRLKDHDYLAKYNNQIIEVIGDNNDSVNGFYKITNGIPTKVDSYGLTRNQRRRQNKKQKIEQH